MTFFILVFHVPPLPLKRYRIIRMETISVVNVIRLCVDFLLRRGTVLRKLHNGRYGVVEYVESASNVIRASLYSYLVKILILSKYLLQHCSLST